MTLLEACRDPYLFAPWFRDLATWQAWFSFIKALFGQPMGEAELERFTRCTGRAIAPTQPASEAWLVCGRRSGKSFILSLIAVYLATFRDWRPHLAPGERATIMVIAVDKRQARVVMRYVLALLHEVDLLRPLVEREGSRAGDMSIDLEGRVTIEVHTASFRSVRGYSIAAALLDELAFWRSDESANPDREVVEALRPAMATLPGSILIGASSPYSRRGMLWEMHRRHYARDGGALVWQAPTEIMNPTVPGRVIAEAMERDPASASAEWHAEFRSDLQSFVDREAVEACIDSGVRERPPLSRHRYAGFVDPSGGRSDSMALAVGHREGDVATVDLVREVQPPFDPAAVVREFADVLRAYRVPIVRGDRYGGEWPAAAFRKHGVVYQAADKPKSDLYRELLPLVNSRRAALLDHPKLVTQLCALERRTARGGRDSIDHPPGAHDDIANSVAGVLGETAAPRLSFAPW